MKDSLSPSDFSSEFWETILSDLRQWVKNILWITRPAFFRTSIKPDLNIILVQDLERENLGLPVFYKLKFYV